MKIHVICVGTEILRGQTLNTDLSFIGQELHRHGYGLSREVCVPDSPEAIHAAIVQELAAADVVITIGGLGPTSDDITRDVAAKALGVQLRLDPDVLQGIEAYLAQRRASVSASAVKLQAMVPDNATVLPNRNGTAPGLWCDTAGRTLIMLPGPPRELQPMFTESAIPRLQQLGCPDRVIRGIKVCGMPESVVAETTERVLAKFARVHPSYCANPGMVDLRLTSSYGNTAELDTALAQVREQLGRAVLAADCDSLPEAVGRLLRIREWWLATAESCTGGGIAATVTDVPGASAFFRGAIVTYANDWKTQLLNVRPETLSTFGAVSAETATAMIDGLFERYDIQAGIAVTGIAGPSGGSPEKPVGLVFIATRVQDNRLVRRHVFPGNRATVRQRTVFSSLSQLRLQLLPCTDDV